jgi:enoyl-[acyl-carrier protein] reductase II
VNQGKEVDSMFKTEICDIFGIEYPIILGGMIWVGRSELVAAVSEAGGLGLLGAGGMTLPEIEQDLEGVRHKTTKPFGVNIPLIRPDADEMIEASIRAGASVISTSAGNPKRYTEKIKARGVKVIHVAFNVTGARKSAEAGVDAVVVEGYEAGGHNGVDEMTTMAIVPQAVRAVDVPVVAAGGICDGKGLVAALSLGAKGVQMGTRFIATHESAPHPNVKEAVLKVKDNGTCITGRTIAGPTRAVRNKLSERILEAEKQGTSSEDLLEMIGEGRSIKACIEGDCEEGTIYCGQIGGCVDTIVSAREVIEATIAEAKTIVDSLQLLVRA